MTEYFPKTAKDTYIYFSEDKIITITLGILQIKLRAGKYEARKPLAEAIFFELVEAINYRRIFLSGSRVNYLILYND
jgi:hypothetical protein